MNVEIRNRYEEVRAICLKTRGRRADWYEYASNKSYRIKYYAWDLLGHPAYPNGPFYEDGTPAHHHYVGGPKQLALDIIENLIDAGIPVNGGLDTVRVSGYGIYCNVLIPIAWRS